MTEQLSLFGWEPPKSPKKLRSEPPFGNMKYNIFFAMFLDSTAGQKAFDVGAEQARLYGLSGRPQAIERLHFTLFGLGGYAEFPSEIVEVAEWIGDQIKGRVFEVTLDMVMSYRAKEGTAAPLVLAGESGMTDLVVFQRQFSVLLSRLGASSKQSFSPHVTLLRDRRSVPRQPIAKITCKMREFVLVNSLLGQTLYVHLKRWALEP